MLREWVSSDRRGLVRAAFVLALAGPSLAACKVVSIEADRVARERLSAGFEAGRYVDGVWSSQALPHWEKSKAPFSEVIALRARDPIEAARRFAHTPGEGARPVYVVEAEGRVTAVTEGRARKIDIAVETADQAATTLTLQVGPVVSGTALRDSLPFVTFNDFSNQIDFAEVGGALKERALVATGGVSQTLRVGDRVRLIAAMPAAADDATLVATPISLERLSGGT